MIRVDEARVRIEERVPALAGRLAGAGPFANLVERDQAPTQTPAGFVLLGNIQGGSADVAAGLFRQNFRETLLVVLFDRHAGDPTGARVMDQMTPLVRDVIAAIVGWGPADAPGVFVLGQAETVGVKQGAMVFQIDFSLEDQLRIAA